MKSSAPPGTTIYSSMFFRAAKLFFFLLPVAASTCGTLTTVSELRLTNYIYQIPLCIRWLYRTNSCLALSTHGAKQAIDVNHLVFYSKKKTSALNWTNPVWSNTNNHTHYKYCSPFITLPPITHHRFLKPNNNIWNSSIQSHYQYNDDITATCQYI